MTVIAAIAQKDRVWMAGDGFAVAGETCMDVAPKVARYAGGTVVAGFSGTWMRGVFKDTDWSGDWQLEFAKHLEARKHKLDESYALIGSRGRIWVYANEYGLFETAGPYAATGSGALGALCALAVTEGTLPEHRLRICLRAVSKHNAYTGGRITVVSTKR